MQSSHKKQILLKSKIAPKCTKIKNQKRFYSARDSKPEQTDRDAMKRVCKRPRPCRLNMTITKMPIDLPGTASLLPQVESILITRDETLFLATSSAIFHVANGRSALLCGHAYDMGYKDGIAFEARFCTIACMAETRTGDLLVSDFNNHCIRRVARNGRVTTVAGCGILGFVDGSANSARFNLPQDIAVHPRRNLVFVADSKNHCMRTVDLDSGQVDTFCGSPISGDCDGRGVNAKFSTPVALAWDNDCNLIVTDIGNHSIKRVNVLDASVSTVAGRSGVAGYVDGPVDSALFNSPEAVIVDGRGTIVVADKKNHFLRLIDAETRVVYTLEEPETSNLPIDSCAPFKMALSARGHLHVVDTLTMTCLRIFETPFIHPRAMAKALTAQQKEHMSLQSGFLQMLQDGKGADVTFTCKDGTAAAHSCILVNKNSFFRALFESGVGDYKGLSKVKLASVARADLNRVLRFVYARKFPQDDDDDEVDFLAMAQTADFFQESDLYDHCMQKFRDNICCCNVVYWLIESHEKKSDDAEAACLNFLTQNFAEFCRTSFETLKDVANRTDLPELWVKVVQSIQHYTRCDPVVVST